MSSTHDHVIAIYDNFLEKLRKQQNFVTRRTQGALDEEVVKGLLYVVLQVAGFAGGGGNAQAGLQLVLNRHAKFAKMPKEETEKLIKRFREAEHSDQIDMIIKPLKLITQHTAKSEHYDLVNRYYCLATILSTSMYSNGGALAEEAMLPVRKALDSFHASRFGSSYVYHRYYMLDKLGLKLSDFNTTVSTPHAPEVAETPAADSETPPAADGASDNNQSKPTGHNSGAGKPATPAASDALAELDTLVGLADVKKEMHDLRALLMLHQRQKSLGMKTEVPALHMVFTGNPGTGKTTIARAVGKIVKELGVLKKGHVVECDRSHLVADYLGQTAGKTNRKIDEAMDGILFIDEAYSLARDRQDQYGQEAIDTLLKRMEDNRDRLIVIVAGYPKPMQKFIDSNPGLKSRFTRTVFFPDYDQAELGAIIDKMVTSKGYTLEPAARQAALDILQRERTQSPEQFGNARDARTLLEIGVQQLAARLQADGSLARSDLSDEQAKSLFATLTLADIQAAADRFGRDAGRTQHTPVIEKPVIADKPVIDLPPPLVPPQQSRLRRL